MAIYYGNEKIFDEADYARLDDENSFTGNVAVNQLCAANGRLTVTNFEELMDGQFFMKVADRFVEVNFGDVYSAMSSQIINNIRQYGIESGFQIDYEKSIENASPAQLKSELGVTWSQRAAVGKTQDNYINLVVGQTAGLDDMLFVGVGVYGRRLSAEWTIPEKYKDADYVYIPDKDGEQTVYSDFTANSLRINGWLVEGGYKFKTGGSIFKQMLSELFQSSSKTFWNYIQFDAGGIAHDDIHMKFLPGYGTGTNVASKKSKIYYASNYYYRIYDPDADKWRSIGNYIADVPGVHEYNGVVRIPADGRHKIRFYTDIMGTFSANYGKYGTEYGNLGVKKYYVWSTKSQPATYSNLKSFLNGLQMNLTTPANSTLSSVITSGGSIGQLPRFAVYVQK